YVSRPEVKPELYASLRPQMYEEGMTPTPLPSAQAARDEARARQMVPAAAAPKAAEAMAKADQEQLAERIDPSASIASLATAEKLGELFSYTVNNVSLPRQSSAMLPIITDDIQVEKLSIYNASVLQKHPLNGARLTNTTDKHLLSGPITVLEDGAYAGDARIDNLPPGQNRLLSYGIDLQMRVDSTRNSSSSAITAGRISEGVLYMQRKYQNTQTYFAENKSERPKQLLVEHPVRGGWKLVDSPKPVETTESLYRFITPVPAGRDVSLTIKEEMVAGETMAILPMDVEQILTYSRTGEIPQAVREALVKAADYKRNLNNTQREINELNQRMNAIAVEQNRIRENMRTVDNKSEYYNRLLKKLGEQESQLEQMQRTRDELTAKMEDQRNQLETYLRGLNVG
ncbi:MAG: hypothetical protein NZ561_09430, partial [Phycisphaerae bacterium]|nr:hypothetical protein [Phycisphaerae bacterium]